MAEQLHALKYVTDTLSAARRDQLPQVVPSLTDHISRCSELLCGRIDAGTTGTARVHKFRTQISSLLQDKSIQGRWTAVVLIKTLIEAVIRHQEGWEFLQTIGSYVRGLLAILGKHDPIPTRTMCMITLTRVFSLTKGRPTLTREITTPHLQSFITLCLGTITGSKSGTKALDQSSAYLETVLQCFIRLLPNHPTVFRPFIGQIRSLICSLLAPTPSDLEINEKRGLISSRGRQTRLAHRLHSFLPTTVAKNGGAEEWKRIVHTILIQIGRTSDQTFRAVRGDQTNGSSDRQEIAVEVSDTIEDELLLPGWHGVSAGCERIVGLLSLLTAYLSTEGASVYQIPVKTIYEVAERMLSVVPPRDTSTEANINRQVSREERETLYMQLPKIHSATLGLLSVTIGRLSILAYAFAEDVLEQVAWLIQTPSQTQKLRVAIYKISEQLFELVGGSLESKHSASVNAILQMACGDATPQQHISDSLPSGPGASTTQYNADSFVAGSKRDNSMNKKSTECQIQAARVLRVAVLRIPGPILTRLRQKINTVAIVSQDQELQLASILNPDPKTESTILAPFLSKNNLQGVLTQAIMYRRMGLYSQHSKVEDDSMSGDEEDGDMEPRFTQVADFSFQSHSGAEARELPPTDIHPATAEGMETIHKSRARATDEIEPEIQPEPKRPRLDVEPEQTPLVVEDQAIGNTELKSIDTRTQSASAEDQVDEAGDSGSESSFEVPEIVVGFSDSEDEAE